MRTPWREPLLMASRTVGPGVTMATAEARMNSSSVAVDMADSEASGQCDAPGRVRPALRGRPSRRGKAAPGYHSGLVL
ncbi:hypothetical protein MyNCGM70_37030 [Achromobacter xylosoxidans]